jgi:hypothetical protein
MTEEQVKTVSELYKEKSNIFLDLNTLTSKDYRFSIGYNTLGIGLYGALSFDTLSSGFREKVKKETIEHLQDRLKQIDKQLEEL